SLLEAHIMLDSAEVTLSDLEILLFSRTTLDVHNVYTFFLDFKIKLFRGSNIEELKIQERSMLAFLLGETLLFFSWYIDCGEDFVTNSLVLFGQLDLRPLEFEGLVRYVRSCLLLLYFNCISGAYILKFKYKDILWCFGYWRRKQMANSIFLIFHILLKTL
ncbi:hypothetical protein ACJX0J_031164, partial [Zea mays]